MEKEKVAIMARQLRLTTWRPGQPNLLDDTSDFGMLKYSRGYLFTPRSGEVVPDGWSNIPFAGGYFYWDPRVSLAAIETSNIALLICGNALHSEFRVANLDEITRKLGALLEVSRAAFLGGLDDLLGQYVVLYREGLSVRAQGDALGMRSVFHTGNAGVLGSHAKLVGEAVGAGPSVYREWVGDVAKYEFPGRSTQYHDVWLLMPNTEVVVGSGRVERVGPVPFAPLSVDEAIDEMIPHFDAQASVLAASGRPLRLSLSAGVDSRSSLAALKGIYGAFETFTYTVGAGPSSYARSLNQDKIAAEISSSVGVAHTMIDLEGVEQPSAAFKRALRESSVRIHGAKVAWAYRNLFTGDTLHIRSQANAVGKSGYLRRLHYRESTHIGADVMVKFTKRAQGLRREQAGPEAYEVGIMAFADYIDATGLRSVPTGYLPSDLLYWEHRLGNWGIPQITESDFTFDTHQLFGSRRLIRAMLSIPVIDRVQGALFRRLVERRVPELLEFPLNGRHWSSPDPRVALSDLQLGR